jgi:phenylpropionate dioxygenase-like ring-hydroxylating dioxygenase large terminal subunit
MVESALWDDWHVVAELESVRLQGRFITRLLGIAILIGIDDATDAVDARRNDGQPIHTATKYGYVWVCLGSPSREIADFAECRDSDRWIVTCGSIRVAVSGLRAVENFLDMGHLAFVHAGYLGSEPFTEVRKHKVDTRPEGGIAATECKLYQPLASPVATDAIDTDYIYEVIRPYTVLLYKTNPAQPARSDLIVLFVQPVTEESCVAHILSAYLKDDIDEAGVRRFVQLIFGQDRPILENQLPKRLPLEPRAEVAVRADASSSAYRRWLQQTGIRYGAIPAY